MIVMVLDHTRDYVHTGGLVADPTNLATTTPMLFLTRWVTHYCAPIFVFLAGVGAYLQLSRGMTTRDLSRFLVTRGLWLIVLEFTVIRVTTWFNFDYSLLANFQVIWTLGVSMVVLAALIHLPLGVIAGIRRGHGRGPQRLRRDPRGIVAGSRIAGAERVGQALDSAASGGRVRAGVRRVRARGLRDLSARAVGRCHRARVRVRIAVHARSRTTAGAVASYRSRAHCRVHRHPRHQSLWRPAAVDAAEHDAVFSVLLRQHDEVPGLAAVPADDDRPRAAGAGLVRVADGHPVSSRSSRVSAACRCSSICGSGRSRMVSPCCSAPPPARRSATTS